MPKRNTTKLVLDHTHCRAICDEIGERFRDALRRDTPKIPPRLLLLLDKLAQLEQMPSIVPSLDEISGAWSPEPFASVKRSADLHTNHDQLLPVLELSRKTDRPCLLRDSALDPADGCSTTRVTFW
jgi:hypothetical protein